MSSWDKIREGLCPNGCGKLSIFKKEMSILYLVPVELLEILYEGFDTPEDIFGYLVAHCDKCGFNLKTPPRHDAFSHLDDITILGLDRPELPETLFHVKKEEN